jgi:NADH:quinone reductase (non-electrogenic)
VSPAAPDARIVILGGGFGGLYAARVLGAGGVNVTLVDRRNFHLFQPLLYQVATGGLSPGDIASPIRAVLRKYPRVRVVLGEVVDIDPAERHVVLRDGERLPYDRLIVSTGSSTSYFGHDDWERRAIGLKHVEEALDMRGRILRAFESAERETDDARRDRLLTFVIVGGGPTGVELAGAVSELARGTLVHDFRRFDPRRARVILVEGGPRLLSAFPARLSARAHRSLENLGVDIRADTVVTDIGEDTVTTRHGEHITTIGAATVLWAAGVTIGGLGARIAERLGATRDRGGRIHVNPDLSVPGHPDVFIAGDMAHIDGPGGAPLPGLAPVAMQEGRYIARRILGRRGADRPFRYRDKGQLAVIGRNAAVADFGRVSFGGFPAWFLWLFVHITYLIDYDNKILVLLQWAFSYFTRKRGARLITGGSDG